MTEELLNFDLSTNKKYPCIICKKSVQFNQNSILCSVCLKWCHVKCGVPLKVFQSDVDWICSPCTLKELPFYGITDVEKQSDSSSLDNLPPLDSYFTNEHVLFMPF